MNIFILFEYNYIPVRGILTKGSSTFFYLTFLVTCRYFDEICLTTNILGHFNIARHYKIGETRTVIGITRTIVFPATVRRGTWIM